MPHKILAVCLGNICRSPLAEGLLRKTAEEQGLDWEIASAGTGSWHVGGPPDPRSRQVARKHGLNIDNQRAQQVTVGDLDHYDLVLAMDRQNYADLVQLAETKDQKEKIKLLLDYTALSKENGPDVFDPYWDDSGFEGVYQLLHKASKRVAEIFSESQ